MKRMIPSMVNRNELPLDVSRQELLQCASDIILKAWQSFDIARPGEPPIDTDLRALAKEPLAEFSTPARQALAEAAHILDASLAQSRPRFFAFVGSSGLEVGVLADALASCFDVNLAVTGKSADLIEAQALKWLGDFIGYPATGGTFTSGGMVSNLTALTAAREKALPNSRYQGLHGQGVALYCSSEAHYSVKRAAEILGLGADNVRGLPIDANRRVNSDDVAKAIDKDRAAGITPIAVIATAGTTLTGAIDPIDELADVCAKRKVWLHVDGAYGLPAASLPELKKTFAGLEKTDSITIDAHKWLYLPKACGVVLVKERKTLAATFSHQENYMLHDESQMNPVDMTLEYSRPFRALKLWLAFRIHGAEQFRNAIRNNLAQAQLCTEFIKAEGELEVLAKPQLSTVPFRHVPKELRDNEAALNEHNLQLVKRMQDDGRVYVSSAVVDNKVCLRPCFVNFRTCDDDVRVLIEVVLELGRELTRASIFQVPRVFQSNNS
jgi:aromatic-L-amino-acid/L-tryptophan decarboxylase